MVQHADSQYPDCISGHSAEPTAVTIPWVQTCDHLMTVTEDMHSDCESEECVLEHHSVYC